MADCFSNYLRDAINDHIHGGGNYTRPATTYYALFTVAPTASGGGTEVSGGSYARVAFTNNSTNWPASSGQTKTNATSIDFGTATADWGTVIAWGEFDASSGGNLLTFGLLTTSRSVTNGTPFEIPVGGAVYNWAA